MDASKVSPESIEVMVTAAGDTLPSYSKYTIPFLHGYCRRQGYRFQFIDAQSEDGRPASWQKLLAYRFANKSTTQVVLIDLDVVILPSAKPIHEALSQDKITIMPRSGAYQCGVWGVPIQYRDWMEGIYHDSEWRDGGGWFEQGFVSRSILNGDVPCNDLGSEWNYIPRTMRHIGAKALRQKNPQFIHCAGNSKPKRKLAKIRSLFLKYGSQIP